MGESLPLQKGKWETRRENEPTALARLGAASSVKKEQCEKFSFQPRLLRLRPNVSEGKQQVLTVEELQGNRLLKQNSGRISNQHWLQATKSIPVTFSQPGCSSDTILVQAGRRRKKYKLEFLWAANPWIQHQAPHQPKHRKAPWQPFPG